MPRRRKVQNADVFAALVRVMLRRGPAELTLREIAQVIKLHESRVSQLKTQAILRLRTMLAVQWPAGRGMVTA